MPVTSVGSDLLKRKTLKSIKRYRQTKQNTEPCNAPNMSEVTAYYQHSSEQVIEPVAAAVPNEYSEYNQAMLRHNSKTFGPNTNINSSSTSSSSGSGATNTSGYASNGLKQAQTTDKQPLKSCLKRKDSQSSSQSQQSGSTKPNTPAQTTRRSHSTTIQPAAAVNATSLIIAKKTAPKAGAIPSRCSHMFVPVVGYLFTCDKESTTRYCYYNKIERSRRVKAYRQLVANKHSNRHGEDSEEEEEDEEENEDETSNNSEQTSKASGGAAITSSRSDNDLRVKKSVTFLAHVIENTRLKSVSPSTTTTGGSSSSSSASSSALATPVAASPYHAVAAAPKPDAPLLQYNALIAMLKLNSEQKKQQQQQEVIKKKNKIANSSQRNVETLPIQRVSNAAETKQFKKEKHDNYASYFKSKAQVIDADSISLGSLSESPPSEFKFSDDEDLDMDLTLGKVETPFYANKSAGSHFERVQSLRPTAELQQQRKLNTSGSVNIIKSPVATLGSLLSQQPQPSAQIIVFSSSSRSSISSS